MRHVELILEADVRNSSESRQFKADGASLTDESPNFPMHFEHDYFNVEVLLETFAHCLKTITRQYREDCWRHYRIKWLLNWGAPAYARSAGLRDAPNPMVHEPPKQKFDQFSSKPRYRLIVRATACIQFLSDQSLPSTCGLYLHILRFPLSSLVIWGQKINKWCETALFCFLSRIS